METWGEAVQAAERLTVIGSLFLLLLAIITDRFLWTKNRGLEWKERAEKAEERARLAEEGLRANTTELERTARRIEESNQKLIDVLKPYVQAERR